MISHVRGNIVSTRNEVYEMKKAYERPELKTTEIKFGVFGDYGTDNSGGGCDEGGRDGHHGGHRSGRRGSWWSI